MKFYKKFVFLLILFIISGSAFAQKFAIGGSVMYNLQSESFGAGLRGSFFPNHTLSIVPQISYYPSFNKVNEYTLGLGLEYKIIRKRKFFFYLLAHGGYNSWTNYQESPMKGAEPNNWNFEGGAGVSMWRCLRPFLEYRYNAKFGETHLQLGLIYVFKCKSNSNPGRGSWFKLFRKKGNCPAYGSLFNTQKSI